MLYFSFGFFFLLFLHCLKKRGISICTILVGLYMLMYLSSVVLINVYDIRMGTNQIPLVYLFSALLLFLYPVYKMHDENVQKLLLPSDRNLNILTYFLMVGSWFAIVYYIPSTVSIIRNVGFGDIASIRNEIGVSGENIFIHRSVFNTIASIFATFYQIQIFLFFIEICRTRRFSKKAILIFISSFSYVFLILSFLGRDGILFWFFSFLTLYSFFYKSMPPYLQKKINKNFIFITGILGLLFIIISMGRFVTSNTYTIKEFFYPYFSYLGQGPINFVDLYDVNFKPTYGGNLFPLFLGEVNEYIVDFNQGAFGAMGVLTNVFSTTIGSYVRTFGYTGTIIFLLVADLFFVLIHQKNNSWSFSFFLIYLLFVMILMQGVFYFRLYDKASNLYILCVFFMAAFYRKQSKKKFELK